MANSLDQNLEGKVVVLRKKIFKPEYRDIKYRVFKVTGGFGAYANTIGRALFGIHLIDGERARYDGFDVERLATEEEIKLVEKEK